MNSNNMDKSYKNNTEPKKAGTKEYALYKYIDREFQDRQNQPLY